jgi:hypothetical protein
MGEDPAQIDGHKKMKIIWAGSFVARLGTRGDEVSRHLLRSTQFAEIRDA